MNVKRCRVLGMCPSSPRACASSERLLPRYAATFSRGWRQRGALYRVHGFSPAEIQKLLLGSLQNAWLSPAEVQALCTKFTNDKHWQIPQSLSTAPHTRHPRQERRI